MKTSSLFAALSIVALSAPAHADLLGETLSFERLYPSVGSPYDPAFTQPTVIVVAGSSDNTTRVVAGNTIVTAMPESTTITFSFVAAGQIYVGNDSGSGTFDGYGISGFSTPPSMVFLASNTTGLLATLTSTTSAVYLDLSGTCTSCPGEIVLDFSPAPVPEASTLTLLTLGLAAVGFGVRRRRAG